MPASISGKRLLVIGASGFLGGSLWVGLSRRFTVLGTYASAPSSGLLPLDLRDQEAIRRVIQETRPDLVLHCGGLTRPDLCEREPTLAHQVNVEGTAHLLEFFHGKVVFFSTDNVFDGDRGPYTEDDWPNPINVYGRTKLLAERLVLGAGRSNLVLRLSKLYGLSPGRQQFLSSLIDPPLQHYPSDAFYTPTLLDDVVALLPDLLEWEGVLHLGGPDIISRYHFTRRAVEVLGLPTKIEPAHGLVSGMAPRPRNCSLRSSRHSLPLQGVEAGLERVQQALTATPRRKHPRGR